MTKLQGRLLVYAVVVLSLLIAFTKNFDTAYSHSPGAQQIASEPLQEGKVDFMPEHYKHGMVLQRHIFVLPKLALPSIEYEMLRTVWMFALILLSSLLLALIGLRYYGSVGVFVAVLPTAIFVGFENFNALFFSNLYWLGFLPALSVVILFYAKSLKQIFWCSFFAAILWFSRGYEYITWYGLLLVTPLVYKLVRKELTFSDYLQSCSIAFAGFVLAFIIVLFAHVVVLYGSVDNFDAYFVHMVSNRIVGLETDIKCYNISIGSDAYKWLNKGEGLYFGNLKHYIIFVSTLLILFGAFRSKLSTNIRNLVFALLCCGLWGWLAALSWYFAAFYHSSCHHKLNDILYIFPSGLFFTAASFILFAEVIRFWIKR